MEIAETLIHLCSLLLAIALAVVFHEVAHGYTALRLGDQTAKLMGRLTLNPIAHIHWFGTIVLPTLLYLASITALGKPFVFAFAKPVPVDFRNLKNPKRDMIWVAAAGPATNIVLAVISAMFIRILGYADAEAYAVFSVQMGSNTLDLTGSMMTTVFYTLFISVIVNVLLAVINMIPIPPADGGRIVTGLLPDEEAKQFAQIEMYGLGILIFILYFNPLNIINWTILPLINVILYLLLEV